MRKLISILTSISFCGAILLVLVGTGTVQVQAQKTAKPQAEDTTEPTVRTDLVVAPKLTADTLADIKRAGKLRVGVSRTVPWAFHSAYDNGKLMGFEIDLGRKMARDMGVEVEFFVEPFHLLIPDLIAGRFDVIMSGMSITPERAMRVNFSNPYATGKLMLASSVAKSKGMNTPEAFNKQDVTVGVIEGSTGAEVAARIFDKAKIRMFDDDSQMFHALVEGEITAAVQDSPRPEHVAKVFPGILEIPFKESLGTYPAAFAARRGDMDFINFLNSWISARKASGWLEARHKYWFEGNEWWESM